MLRILSFLHEASGQELILPVTPPAYSWHFGNQVETVRLDQVGEIGLPGTPNLGRTTIEALLPAQLYPFCSYGAVADPDYYLDALQHWCERGDVVRWIVSGTRINAQVLIEEVSWGESDGTNDIQASITLRGWRRPETPVLDISGGGAATGRDDATGAASARRYTVQPSDTLWSICQHFYGAGDPFRQLASANEIPNPYWVEPGTVLTIPAREDLPGPQERIPSQAISDDTKSLWDPKTGTWRLVLEEVDLPDG